MASSLSHRVSLRTDNNIYLIGSMSNQIIGSKLPSNKQVLSVLFHNLRIVKLNLRESAVLVIKETVIFWQKARIPVREEHRCVNKLEKLYQDWRNLQKSANRLSDKNRTKFIDELDNLFDIAHGNSLNMIRIEEDKMFLLSQRQKGRPGCMLGIDHKLSLREKRTEVQLQKLNERRKRSLEEMEDKGNSITNIVYSLQLYFSFV